MLFKMNKKGPVHIGASGTIAAFGTSVGAEAFLLKDSGGWHVLVGLKIPGTVLTALTASIGGVVGSALTAVFNAQAGLDALHIPFQGSGPAMAAFLGGQVDFAIETIAAAGPLVKQGALRLLGITTKKSSALLPGVPPLAEAADVPGYDIGGWNGLLLPAATPQPILDRLLAEVEAGFATAEMKDRFLGIGVELAPIGPDGFRALLRAEAALFGPIIRQLGIRAE